MNRQRIVFAAEAGTGNEPPPPASNVIAQPLAGNTPPPPPPAGNTPPPPPPPPTTFTIDLSTATPEQRELFVKKGYDKNPNGLLGSYYDANKVLSGAKDVVAIPADDAKPDSPEVQRYRAALGIPEKSDDYKFEYEAGSPTPDPNTEAFGRKFFHELGIPQSKVPKALAMWNEFAKADVQRAVERRTQANVDQIKALQGGMNEAQWNKVVADGQTAFKALNLPPETHVALEAAIGSAAVVHLFSALGAKMQEGGFRVPDAGNSGPPPANTLTPEQAQQQIATLQADAEFQKKYLDKNHVEHPQSVRRMAELYAVAYNSRR